MDCIRKLAPANWNRLQEFPDKITPPMGGCRAFVAESRDGKLVGRIFIVSVAHLEGIYVDESRRGSALMNLLVQRAEGELRMIGASTAFAYGNGQVMEDYIARLAYLKEPWSVWRKELAPCR